MTPIDVVDETEQTSDFVQRHSTRERRPPSWLNDFVVYASIANNSFVNCNSSIFNTCNAYTPCTFPYTISPNLRPTYDNFLTNGSSVCEPSSYDKSKRNSEWVQAMNTEIEVLKKNKTWEMTELPPGKQAIGSKWVYRIKCHVNGSIDRYKARLVAKGYHQIEGIDFSQSPSHLLRS